MMRPLIAVVFVAALLVGCAGSVTEGYVATSTFRDDIQTIAIPIFDNRTFTRDIEFELTDALIKEVQRRTPYRIENERRTETTLTGTIRKVELTRLSRSTDTGLSEEGVLRVTIDFEWKDLRDGHTLISREEYTGQALFVPSSSREPVEIGQFAVVQQLARDIVSEMRSEW